MRNVVLVIKHEIRRTVGKPSFWLTAFLFPLIIFTITFGSQLLASGMSNGNSGNDFLGTISGQTPTTEQPRGYVDLAGVIKRLPEGLPAGLLRPYADEASAQDATARGEISQYYVVPPDFLSTGDIMLVQGTFSPFEALGSGNIFEYVVTYNLTGNADTAALLLDPTPTVHVVTQSSPETGPAGAGGQTGAVGSIASMGMLFIFFFVLTMSSGFMLRSVTKEKESRVVEILLSSLDPRELMLGKIIGLGAVGLLQMVIWLGGGMLILREGSPVFGIASAMMALNFPPGFLLWALLYFLLGYMTFASALGAIGTLAPTAREAGQFTFLILFPLMLPIWLNTAFMQAPEGALVTFLSIFPLTSPVSMIARLAVVPVPWWQLALSLGLMGATTYGFVVLSARFFKADTLLSSAPLDFKRLLTEVRQQFTR